MLILRFCSSRGTFVSDMSTTQTPVPTRAAPGPLQNGLKITSVRRGCLCLFNGRQRRAEKSICALIRRKARSGGPVSRPGSACSEESPQFPGDKFRLAAVVRRQMSATCELDVPGLGEDPGESAEGGLEVGRALAAAEQEHLRGDGREGREPAFGPGDQLGVVMHCGHRLPQRVIPLPGTLC